MTHVSSIREKLRDELAKTIDEQHLARWLGEGAELSRDTVCEFALGSGKVDRNSDARSGDLTARQAEVLRLVARGMTDKQVARELGLSPRTVEMHVARAIESLHCTNRTEAVRVATERGLVR